MEHVRVTSETYERVRSTPTDFVLKPGHAVPEVETVVESSDEFDVVRKTGQAAVLVNELDPRPGA